MGGSDPVQMNLSYGSLWKTDWMILIEKESVAVVDVDVVVAVDDDDVVVAVVG